MAFISGVLTVDQPNTLALAARASLPRGLPSLFTTLFTLVLLCISTATVSAASRIFTEWVCLTGGSDPPICVRWHMAHLHFHGRVQSTADNA